MLLLSQLVFVPVRQKSAGHLQNTEQQKRIWIKVSCLEIIIMEVLLQESERLSTMQACFSVLTL